jgi:FRG domain
LTKPIEHGAFVSLVQHHGYPTPLLDWTYSPFIGAYFAFRDAPQSTSKVRVFIFDRAQWKADWKQLQKVAPAQLHFSILDPIALNNPRMVPQQALSTVTNAVDIEGYIERKVKERPDRKYLHVIDLPTTQRKEALRDLSAMGITAGSMFPGLDGACSQVKDRLFGF